jgi:plastocyanin
LAPGAGWARDGRLAGGGKHRLPLDGDTVDLGSDVTVHDVRLGGAGAGAAIRPTALTVRSGDVIRFVAADARGHAVAFVDSTLAPDVHGFLERTHQLRGPPLISTGASWVVSLKGAPAGRYPFRALTQDAAGVVVVQPAPAR